MLTNYNGTAISYDAIGNPTNWRNTYSMSWDARRLTNQRLNNSDWLTYTYNSSGIRTQKYFFNDIEMYGTTHDYVLDGTNIIRETVTGGGTNYTLYYLYDETGSVQGFIYNNNYYYYQKNLQGDVIRILNYSGNVVVEYTYDAWGKVLTTTGTLASTIGQYNPFRYRSYYYDTETGFYYLQSRYYDPVVGRFLNADGIVGANGGIEGYNMFAYCNNNPIVFSDETGFALRANTKIVNDGSGGDIGPLGMIGSDYYQKVNERINCAYDWFHNVSENDDFEYALYDNDRFKDDTPWHEQLCVVSTSSPSFGFDDGKFSAGVGGVSFDAVTGGWEWEGADLSLFDFGHIEACAEISSDGFQIGAMASAWSPSFSFDVFGVTIEIGAEVGSVGTVWTKSSNSFSGSIAAMFGISFGVSW